MKKKIDVKNATMKAFPLPVTLVTCMDKKGNPNIITVTYVTGVNEEPPMVAIAIRPEKYSNKLIRETKEFAINVPTKELLSKIDYCGSFSGQEVDKFAETGLNTDKASVIQTPLIKECPISLECKLVKTISFPSHDLFVGEVVAVHVEKELLLDEIPDFSRLCFLLTTFFDYREIGKKVGTAFKEHDSCSDFNPYKI